MSGKALESASIGVVRKDEVLEVDVERAWGLTHTADDWDGGVVFEFDIF